MEKFKNIHAPVDTFSGAVFASVHAGESDNHACQHFLQAFATRSVPQERNTDDSPAYTAQNLSHILRTGVLVTLLAFPTLPQVKQLLNGHITL